MLKSIYAQLKGMPSEYTGMFERLRLEHGVAEAYRKVKEIYRLEAKL